MEDDTRNPAEWVARRLNGKQLWMLAGALIWLGITWAGLIAMQATLRAHTEQLGEIERNKSSVIYVDRQDQQLSTDLGTAARRAQTALDRNEANRVRAENNRVDIATLKERTR